MTRASRAAAGLGVMALLLACCATRSGEQTEAIAPDFTVIPENQLHSTMGQLALGVRSLQILFGDDGEVDLDEQADVLLVLDRMIAAADALGAEPVSAGHPQVGHNLPNFRGKLEIARRSAAMVPPRYYLVGNLSGTCLACHGGL
jgi:hypothetical protein